jgi:Mce-associated membrane protein
MITAAGAVVVDVLFGVGVVATAALLALAAAQYSWLWWLSMVAGGGMVLVIVLIVANRLLLPAATGRSLSRVMMTTAALVSVGAAGLSYQQVYRHERAVDATRSEIVVQGPKIVEEVLSYSADSKENDFTRAHSLATEGYRALLIAQQQAALNARVGTNKYSVVNGAVLDVSTDRASMLLFLQGQRTPQANPRDVRFVSATVRADFEKSRAGRWQLSGLTVLAKPFPGARSQ